MLCVYFDTNVYDHIDKGYIARQEVDALRMALGRGDVTAHLSITNVEELLGQWEKDRMAAIRKLRVAGEIVGFDEIFKQPSDLLADAYRAYAAGEPQSSPMMPPDQLKIVVGALR